MSRSDLDRIQARLKVAIQNHQMLVAKMRSDPQSLVLQEQLHELQSQITSLSGKQKMIVQHLRKELVVNPNQDSPSPAASPGLQITLPALDQPIPAVNTTTVVTAPNTILQPTRSLVSVAPRPTNNLQSTSPVLKTQNTEVVKPLSQGVNSVLNNNNKTIKCENVLGISQKSNTATLRVPQIHSNRPSILQGTPRHLPGKLTNSPLVPVSARRGSDTDLSNYKKMSISKEATPAERKKLEFMASLDLITHGTLKELQNRRSERKRRSTANPQFSYGHFEPERKREAATYLSQVPIQPGVRRRGRPPKTRSHSDRSTPTSPLKGTHSVTATGLAYNTGCSHSLSFCVENDVHEDFCAVCVRSGELLMCDSCNLVYHLDCLDPPIANIPQGLWSCPKCQAMNKQTGTDWPGTLALVHSYITHKAAKEEEKRKLSKQVQDLRNENNNLEMRAATLTDGIAQQLEKKTELVNAYHTAQQSVDKLKNLIRVFQTS